MNSSVTQVSIAHTHTRTSVMVSPLLVAIAAFQKQMTYSFPYTI